MLWSWPLALLAAAVMAAQASESSLAQLPTCADECLVQSLGNSTCPITDQYCMCKDSSLQQQMTLCVLSNCSMTESLVTKNATDIACGVTPRNRSRLIVVISNVLGSITGYFVVQRLATKLWLKVPLGWDDGTTVIAILLGAPSTVFVVYGLVPNGLGRDIWTLEPHQIDNFGKFFYAALALYVVHVAMIKMCFLTFYLRVFPSVIIRRLLWSTVAFIGAYALSFFLAAVFSCTPVSYYWTRWDKPEGGHCRDINAVVWSNAAISIALDLWVMAIPLSQVRALRLGIKKKIGAALMLCVGAFVTIVSIIRLRSLVKYNSNSQNPTWEYTEVTIWSVIEINVGIICACLPSTRLLLVRLFSCLADTPVNSSLRYIASSGRGGTSGPNSRSHRRSNNTPIGAMATLSSRLKGGKGGHAVNSIELEEQDEEYLVAQTREQREERGEIGKDDERSSESYDRR